MVHCPETLLVIPDLEYAVARVMPLAAIGARDEAADVHAFVIEIVGDSESRTATARDEKEAVTS